MTRSNTLVNFDLKIEKVNKKSLMNPKTLESIFSKTILKTTTACQKKSLRMY